MNLVADLYSVVNIFFLMYWVEQAVCGVGGVYFPSWLHNQAGDQLLYTHIMALFIEWSQIDSLYCESSS